MDLHRDEEQRTVAPTAAQRCELIDHHSADVRRGGGWTLECYFHCLGGG